MSLLLPRLRLSVSLSILEKLSVHLLAVIEESEVERFQCGSVIESVNEVIEPALFASKL